MYWFNGGFSWEQDERTAWNLGTAIQVLEISPEPYKNGST